MFNSLKQLLRTPVKAVLFFLLMAACSLLLVFGSVMLIESMQRINAAEEQFTTIGTVTQKPSSTRNETITWNKSWGQPYTNKINEYEEILPVEVLNFEDAGYINAPEYRPYYQVYLPECNTTAEEQLAARRSTYIIEFIPLKDYVISDLVEVQVTRILLNKETSYDRGQRQSEGIKDTLEVGDTIALFDSSIEKPAPMEAGKTYICNLVWDLRPGYMVYPPPYSTQYGAPDGEYMSPSSVREGKESSPIDSRIIDYNIANPPCSYTEEVTDNFYEESERGQAWLAWIEAHKQYDHWFQVLPTNGLQLLPVFHDRQAYVSKGREITDKEFERGAQVCMVSANFAAQNLLDVGDKITLPLSFALYSYLPDRAHVYRGIAVNYATYYTGYSPLKANMKPYEPFWEAEYEIVGTYQPISPDSLLCGTTELARDMFIIPSKSVKASDENNIASYGPMNALTTSFQIPNGTIEEFDAKLRAAVPEVEQLTITYNDNGYTEVITTLNTARLTAFLLFAVGVLATLAIVVLLLFFFIIKQKKRTAVERSLGMSKKQCRKSLIAGVLALTLAASIVGSVCGALALNAMDSKSDITETTGFSTDYSIWAANKTMEVELSTADVIVTTSIYFAIPILLVLLVYLLSIFLVGINLKIEPILLLSTKVE